MARGVGKPPDPADLWKEVSTQDKIRISAWNRSQHNPNPGGSPIVNPYEYAESVTHTGIGSPMSAIPLAASKGQFSVPVYEVVEYFGDDLRDMNADSVQYYAWNDEGFMYANNATVVRADEEAAPITVVPTSTTNPERPRTVAAGYDFSQRKLTVIFRDGTYYNYFDVENTQWQNFKRSRSKGRFIKSYLDSHARGVADVTTMPPYARDIAYRFIRTGQHFRGGVQPGQSTTSKRGTGYAPGNLGGTGRARLKKSLGQSGPSGISSPKKP